MQTKSILTAVAVVGLALVLIPSAAAQVEDQEDVRAEPTSTLDNPSHPAVSVGNGFPPTAQAESSDTEFSPQDWTQVLDGFYGKNVWPVAQQEDVNNYQRHYIEEVAGVDGVHEDHIYPGRTDFGVWWGWWLDKPKPDDSEDRLTAEATLDGSDGDTGRIYDINDVPSNRPPASASPACDSHPDPTGYACADTNLRDEFKWRGDWGFDTLNSNCGPCETRAGDDVRLFIQPGTMDFNSFAPAGSTLNSGADDGAVPDTSLVDDTDSVDGQTYFNEGNNWAYNYHRSLAITTRVVTSVNPQPQPGGTYDIYTPAETDGEGDGVDSDDGMQDTDFYTSVAPAVEDAFRLAVWNPHDDYDEAGTTALFTDPDEDGNADEDADGTQGSQFKGDAVRTTAGGSTESQGDGGVYEFTKWTWNKGFTLVGATANEEQQSAEDDTVSSKRGLRQALSGDDVDLHEPTTPSSFTDPTGTSVAGDDYPNAGYSDRAYVADADEGNMFYYDPAKCDGFPDSNGDGQLSDAERESCLPDGWDGYHNNDHLWGDADAEWWASCWCVVLFGQSQDDFQVVPNTADFGDGDQESQNTLAPGSLDILGNVGQWADMNGDNWIGDLDEFGRTADSAKPYADGQIEDPNDYGDTAKATKATPDSIKSGNAEYEGLAKKATATIELTPLTENREWGQLGVYVFADSDTARGANFNPWDDVVADSAGTGETSAEEVAWEAAGCPALGCEDPGWLVGLDDDGRYEGGDSTQSGALGDRHVTQGTITGTYVPSEFENGGSFTAFEMKEDIIFPTGSLNYPVKVSVTFSLTESVDARGFAQNGPSHDLSTETVRDVDVLMPASGSSWSPR